MKKVSVIISNKNTAKLLQAGLRNLEEIKKHDYEDLEVIVVDRGSTDNSVEMIKSQYPSVKLVESEDKGLSVSSNAGAKVATGEYFLFLGPDAYPRNRTIGGMVNYMEAHPDIGLATPKLYLEKGALDPDAHRAFPTPWNSFTRLTGLYLLFPKSKLFNSYFMSFENLDVPHEIDACVFGFMLVRRSVFEEVGGFDPDYYVHGEDLDLCYKIKESGHKVMYLPQWESGHLKTRVPGSKSGEAGTKEKASLSLKTEYAQSSTSAMRTFMNKHYRNKYAAPLLWFMNLGTYLLEFQRVSTVTIKHLLS
ncbi:hypothetical protein A2886_02690 [candidate division WWE3 bacterium RIFCSPHIGHO2_01_FULL_42_13]|uniref:Glycosyltransferase 2-like domain-containing protein n=1 Tax=candidate division WWE3 bacterium RIFCSPHIGHO2_01_FULL_42_13 TaxID=1802617 RepID=A0A1F4URX9_UNCKA|nr:MAG: hypothetical protein A2886_02690 [candidate division WWE3 bacterium RIFCSPHIGHO2_01_FULL_42_13]